MNTKQDEVLSMERALKLAQDWYDSGHEDPDEFVEMIKQVIALAEQPAPVAEPHKQQSAERVEPMAWIERDMQCDDYDPDSVTCQKSDIAADGWEWVPLYTSPQPSKSWVGLTQQDINIAFDDTQEGGGFDDFARAIEAKLREKNNG